MGFFPPSCTYDNNTELYECKKNFLKNKKIKMHGKKS